MESGALEFKFLDVFFLWLAASGSRHRSRVFPSSCWNAESDGVTDSCGQEDPTSVSDSRLLITSPAPLTACPRWDDAAGTDGHLAAEHLMKHTPPFFLTHHLLFHQHRYCLCHTSGRATRKRRKQPHMTTFMQNPCLFISCHDSIAISCLVVVCTCQALWDVLGNSWPVHTFPCWDGTFVKSEQRS